MLNFKGMRFPIDVILVCIRWYVTYPLSYRHLEEMMEERGVSVDHSSINRWAIRFLPHIEKMARKRKRKRPVGSSWRMDETYIKVKGVSKYLYRAVDKHGRTVDFLLTAKRDKAAAHRFFDKAMGAALEIPLVPAQGRIESILRLALRVHQRADDQTSIPNTLTQLACALERF